MKAFKISLLFFALYLILTGCAVTLDSDRDSSAVAGGTIILAGTSITAGDGVTVEGTTATITAAGVYEISGSLEDGQIIVDAVGNVELVLESVDIHCDNASAIYIRDAKLVTITLPEGSSNTMSDGAIYDFSDGSTLPDATIYSKSDMVIAGSGALTVTANYQDGITSKDTLRIDGGSIYVTAAANGIKGKDYLIINDGEITVQAGNDGIKATNDTQTSLGYVEINGGDMSINAADEGISAVTSVIMTGGNISIDSENNGVKADGVIEITGGILNITAEDNGLVCQERIIGDDAAVTVNGSAVST